MAKRASISFLQTSAIVYGEKHFPVKTLRRWHLIAEFVEKCFALVSDTTVIMLIGEQESCSNALPFKSTAEICRLSFELIRKTSSSTIY